MTFPIVKGWIIDYRAAAAIFASGNNARISYIISLCEDNNLFVSLSEENHFKSNILLKKYFIDSELILVPTEDEWSRCDAISQTINGQIIPGDDGTAFIIPSMAAVRGFGVICDHASSGYKTAFDICGIFGVPVYRNELFFKELNI